MVRVLAQKMNGRKVQCLAAVLALHVLLTMSSGEKAILNRDDLEKLCACLHVVDVPSHLLSFFSNLHIRCSVNKN